MSTIQVRVPVVATKSQAVIVAHADNESLNRPRLRKAMSARLLARIQSGNRGYICSLAPSGVSECTWRSVTVMAASLNLAISLTLATRVTRTLKLTPTLTKQGQNVGEKRKGRHVHGLASVVEDE